MTKKLHYILSALILFGCSKKPEPLFRLLPPNQTGISFQNAIQEDEYLNILSNEYIYNGAGVGIGDFNNDDLLDIFFSGSQVTNKLYINQGNLTFKDISLEARISGRSMWSTGVAIVDINDDGWQDIYICVSNHLDPEMRRNQLFINDGLNENGVPVFSEQSKSYGIDDVGYSTHAAFFDYDNDDDLDLYVLTNFLDTPTPNKYRVRRVDGSAESNDRLYRNNGDNTFTNVTIDAGILFEGYGLGVSIVDFNNDGWRDIYISNDYLTNDLMYINNQDGTFTNKIDQYIKHQTHSAMGHDIADINNDGLVDIFTLDMLPEDNQGMKKMHGVTRFENEELNKKFGYQPQYKRNMLQLNNGPDAFGNHNFSEIGLFAGVYATEWSWSALLADYDNDGFRDLFVSNGYPRDVTDLDYAVSGMSRGGGISNEEQMMMIPVRSMSNYIFRNRGNLTFENITVDWGMQKPSFSNGAAYADLDNDGDLEIVTSNYNESALLYENTLNEVEGEEGRHFLRLKLMGNSSKTLGAKVYVFSGEEIKFTDHSPFRGFRSTVEPLIHIGLGAIQKIDSLVIYWPDGRRKKMVNVQVDQILEVDHANVDLDEKAPPGIIKDDHLLRRITLAGLDYLHQESIFDDYSLQETIPRQFSQSGPPITTGDVDGNGLEDIFIGGSRGKNGIFFLQYPNRFESWPLGGGEQSEDTDVQLFDADHDGDLDLYIVSGSQESGLEPANYQDRFFFNEGSGNFSLAEHVLPKMPVSGSCVRVSDIDDDGDLDLFIGGRLVPGKYPQKTSSYILRNELEEGHLKFRDITNEVCEDLRGIGLITDAIWVDFNQDDKKDLVVVGEYMPITFFENQTGKFVNMNANSGLENKKGWWNCIRSGDFDQDGDLDFIAGNEGLNSWFKASADEPITAYSADFNNDGRYDVILTQFLWSKDGSRKAFPTHFKSDLAKQLDRVSRKFASYASYSEAVIEDLFSYQELEGAQVSSANWMANSYIENQGEGNFKLSALPGRSQFAPVNDILIEDVNRDGNLDAVLVGNNTSNSVFWGPMDAMNGLVMLGNGKGDFECLYYSESGFFVPGDSRSIGRMKIDSGKDIFIATQNQDSLRIFELLLPPGEEGRGD